MPAGGTHSRPGDGPGGDGGGRGPPAPVSRRFVKSSNLPLISQPDDRNHWKGAVSSAERFVRSGGARIVLLTTPRCDLDGHAQGANGTRHPPGRVHGGSLLRARP